MTPEQKINKVLSNNSRYISGPLVDRIMASEYQRQAIDFLIETETTCQIVLIGKAVPSWGKQAVNHYSVTLKNARHTYTFNFYDSIKNTEDDRKATYDFYSVLACLYLSHCDNFDDFCANYGYEFKNEREYIKVKQTFLDVQDQDKNLRKLFTDEELEKLSDIN